MKAWIGTDENGRVNVSTTIEKYSTGMTEIEVDDDFDFGKQMDYVFKDGELVRQAVGARPKEEILALLG